MKFIVFAVLASLGLSACTASKDDSTADTSADTAAK